MKENEPCTCRLILFLFFQEYVKGVSYLTTLYTFSPMRTIYVPLSEIGKL